MRYLVTVYSIGECILIQETRETLQEAALYVSHWIDGHSPHYQGLEHEEKIKLYFSKRNRERLEIKIV